MLLLTILAKKAAERIPKVKAGRTNASMGFFNISGELAEAGSHLSFTAKI